MPYSPLHEVLRKTARKFKVSSKKLFDGDPKYRKPRKHAAKLLLSMGYSVMDVSQMMGMSSKTVRKYEDERWVK